MRIPRKQRRSRPRCPVHLTQLLVGRTLGTLQYRYCPVPGCRMSLRTRRLSFAEAPTEPAPAGDSHE